jgi:hypothetical protein
MNGNPEHYKLPQRFRLLTDDYGWLLYRDYTDKGKVLKGCRDNS